MATNRDLLKEAIADAKAVKETAIANAKAALEESFTPFLREKLAQKINELDEMDLEGMDEMLPTTEMQKSYELEEEELSLDELLAELENENIYEEDEALYEAKKKESEESEEEEPEESKEDEKEEMSIEDMTEEDLTKFIEGVIQDMISAGELEAGHEGMENEKGAEEETDEMSMGAPAQEIDEYGDMDIEEEINLDELLAEIAEAKKRKVKKVEKKVEKSEKEEELKEAYSTIKTLQSELNEINLLNAKLLYANKIFRNKSLNESQKIKVLSSFDKARTKQEAQLVYETLQESLKTSTVSTKSTLKESLGSASKVLGNASAKPIIENDAFARMRELAGLTKK